MLNLSLNISTGYPSNSHILTAQSTAGGDSFITIGHSILDSTQFIMPEDK